MIEGKTKTKDEDLKPKHKEVKESDHLYLYDNIKLCWTLYKILRIFRRKFLYPEYLNVEDLKN